MRNALRVGWRTASRGSRPRRRQGPARGPLAVLMLAVLVAVGPAGGTEDRRGRLQACVMGFNEPDEVEVFGSQLDPQRFAFVDLRTLSPTRPGASASGTEWLLDACVPAVHCDLLVISGEFAGHFFGTRGSVSLQALEEASCQAPGAGLFRRPRQVFLLGCNTLATKDQDRRTAGGIPARAGRARLRPSHGRAGGRAALRAARAELP